MKKTRPVTDVLTTNFTIVEAVADIQMINSVFARFPNRFLPVVVGLKFIGVILREEFFQKHIENMTLNIALFKYNETP